LQSIQQSFFVDTVRERSHYSPVNGASRDTNR
jgi:hypothetical protein